MKTAKQIKQGLTECAYAHGSCGLCPYDRPGNGVACQRELKEDSLALIKQLEVENDDLRLSFAKQAREVEEWKLKFLKMIQQVLGLPTLPEAPKEDAK